MISKAVNALILAFIAAIGFIFFRTVGPAIEVSVKPPIHALTFENSYCLGEDLVAVGTLDKTAYGDGEAEFLGMTLFSTAVPRQRLAWRQFDETDQSPPSRPSGQQVVRLRVSDGCDKAFKAHTRHISPITGLILPMSFGPFNQTQ